MAKIEFDTNPNDTATTVGGINLKNGTGNPTRTVPNNTVPTNTVSNNPTPISTPTAPTVNITGTAPKTTVNDNTPVDTAPKPVASSTMTPPKTSTPVTNPNTNGNTEVVSKIIGTGPVTKTIDSSTSRNTNENTPDTPKTEFKTGTPPAVAPTPASSDDNSNNKPKRVIELTEGDIKQTDETTGKITVKTPEDEAIPEDIPTPKTPKPKEKSNDVAVHSAQLAAQSASISTRNIDSRKEGDVEVKVSAGVLGISTKDKTVEQSDKRALDFGVAAQYNINKNNAIEASIGATSHRAVAGRVAFKHNIDTESGTFTPFAGINSAHATKNIGFDTAKTERGVFAGFEYKPKDYNVAIKAQVDALNGRTFSHEDYKATRASLGVDYSFGKDNRHSVGASVSHDIKTSNNLHGSTAVKVGYTYRWGGSSSPSEPEPVRNPPIITTNFTPKIETKTKDIPVNTLEFQSDTYFKHNSAKLITPLENTQMAKLSEMLNDPKALKNGGTLYDALHADGKHLKVIGHTDYTGDQNKINLPLSRNRADSVERYLVSEANKHGAKVDVSKIILTEGRGESEVKFKEADVEKLGLNRTQRNEYIKSDRRVDIVSEAFSPKVSEQIDFDYLKSKYPSDLLKIATLGVNRVTNTYEQDTLKSSSSEFIVSSSAFANNNKATLENIIENENKHTHSTPSLK